MKNSLKFGDFVILGGRPAITLLPEDKDDDTDVSCLEYSSNTFYILNKQSKLIEAMSLPILKAPQKRIDVYNFLKDQIIEFICHFSNIHNVSVQSLILAILEKNHQDKFANCRFDDFLVAASERYYHDIGADDEDDIDNNIKRLSISYLYFKKQYDCYRDEFPRLYIKIDNIDYGYLTLDIYRNVAITTKGTDVDTKIFTSKLKINIVDFSKILSKDVMMCLFDGIIYNLLMECCKYEKCVLSPEFMNTLGLPRFKESVYNLISK